MIRLIVLLILVISATLGCRDNNVLSSAGWTWKENQWLKGDRKSFTMTVSDTTVVYQLDLEVKHATDYGFQNLYVRTVTTYPSGKEVTSVTSLELAEKDGTWAGDCGGKSCSINLPLQARFTFPETGTYTWTIEPYMRMDTVTGIRSLTVTCSEVTE